MLRYMILWRAGLELENLGPRAHEPVHSNVEIEAFERRTGIALAKAAKANKAKDA